jgi:tetratricopeptide (TPR) repeat protein
MGGFRRSLMGACVLAMTGALALPVLAQTRGPALQDRNVVDENDGRSAAEVKRLYDDAFAAMMNDPGDLDKTFRFAGLAVRVGDLEGAVGALERMLLINSNLPRVRLELGVLYFRLGSYEAARSYLLSALETPNMPADVRERAQKILVQIDKQKAPTRFSGTVLAGLRWQSNANAAPTGSVRVGGFEAELDDNSTAAPDWNAFVAAQLVHLWDFGWQSGDHLDSRANLYVARQFQREEVNASVAVASVGPRFVLLPETIPGLSLRTAVAVDYVMLDDRQEYWAAGAALSLDKRWENSLLSLGFDFRRREYHDSTEKPFNSFRDGDEWTGRISWEHAVNEWLGVSLSAGYSRYKAKVDWESYREALVALGLTFQTIESPFVRQDVVLAVSLAHLRSNYDKVDVLVDPDTKRKDKDWRVALTLNVPVAEEWSVVLQGGYNRRDSSVPNYEYENWFTMMGVAWRF